MRIKAIIVAGALAVAGAWGVASYGPQTLAIAKEQAIGAAMRHHQVDPQQQQTLLRELKAKYPRIAAKAEGWHPVTPTKIEALSKAYRELPLAERKAIAKDVNAWKRALVSDHPALKKALTGETDRQVKKVMGLPATEREALSTKVLALWERLEAKHPRWVAEMDTILSR